MSAVPDFAVFRPENTGTGKDATFKLYTGLKSAAKSASLTMALSAP